MDGLVAAVAVAEEARGDLSETGGEWAVVEGITCLRVPVRQPWAVQAKIMWPRPPEALEAALKWMGSLTVDHGRVMTRQLHAEAAVFAARGLHPAFALPVMARTVDPLDVQPVDGLEIGPATSADEVRAVLCAEDPGLAPLVTDAHLCAKSHRYLIARLGGTPVGCAFIRLAAGTAYISGVAVLAEARGRGVGTAVSSAASTQAAALQPGPVWLHAQQHVLPLYRRLGYRLIGVHVQLGRDPGLPYVR